MKDVVFDILALGGILMLLVGVVYSNIVVYAMAKTWNRTRPKEERIPAWAAWGKGAANFQPIGKYRSEFGNDSLSRQLRIAYWLCGVGGTLGIGTILVGKLTGI